MLPAPETLMVPDCCVDSPVVDAHLYCTPFTVNVETNWNVCVELASHQKDTGKALRA